MEVSACMLIFYAHTGLFSVILLPTPPTSPPFLPHLHASSSYLPTPPHTSPYLLMPPPHTSFPFSQRCTRQALAVHRNKGKKVWLIDDVIVLELSLGSLPPEGTQHRYYTISTTSN